MFKQRCRSIMKIHERKTDTNLVYSVTLELDFRLKKKNGREKNEEENFLVRVFFCMENDTRKSKDVVFFL